MIKRLNVVSIQEAMDFIHTGICICKPSGTPLLVNNYMYDLVFQLTGTSLLNANVLWEELEGRHWKSGEMFKHWNLIYLIERMEDEEVYVISDDSRIFRFRKYRISDENGECIEIMANDITQTALLLSDIHKQNLKLNHQNHIMNEQLKRRYEINKSEEILKSKIGLHRKLGEAIIATKSVIYGEKDIKTEELNQFWNGVLEDLMKKKGYTRKEEQDKFEELQTIAKMLHCEIDYSLEIFDVLEWWQLDLFIDLVREALFNAIRHGNANRLFIRKYVNASDIRINIYDNGKFRGDHLNPVGGMRNLIRMFKEKMCL